MLQLRRLPNFHPAAKALAACLVVCIITALPARAETGLVAWWKGDGNAVDSVGGNNGTLTGAAGYAAGSVGQAFNFTGQADSVQVPDGSALKITGSLTLKATIKIAALPPSGQAIGFIAFRGDNRPALDPYFLGLLPDGNLVFHIENAAGVVVEIKALCPVGQFVEAMGTLDATSGQMNLYLNGALSARTVTNIRPFGDLVADQAPGFSIGNVTAQQTSTLHLPFNGLIDEVKIYNVALVPAGASSVFGDLNSDGVFDLRDIVFGLRVWAGLQPAP